MKNCYVVTMYRWGDRECHSYVLGVFSKKTRAEKAAKREEEYRGGKYSPECIEIPIDMELDCLSETKKIIPLIKHPIQ